jgi:hypothetical protein
MNVNVTVNANVNININVHMSDNSFSRFTYRVKNSPREEREESAKKG